MPTITVRGETAEVVWKNVRDSVDLLDVSRRVRKLEGEARYRAELQLCAFLQSLRYGESWPRIRGYRRNFDYFEELDRTHRERRGFVKLRQSKSPLTMQLVMEPSRSPIVLELGYAEGITTVIPMSEKGYQACLSPSGPRFDPPLRLAKLPHYIPKMADLDAYYYGYKYIYIGTLFHISKLYIIARNPGDIIFSPDVPKPGPFIKQLYHHIAEFLPPFIFVDNYPTLRGGHKLPVLCSATAADFAEKMVEEAGFEFMLTNKSGHKIYRLDLNELGVHREGADDARLGRARRVLLYYFGPRRGPTTPPSKPRGRQD